MNNFCQKSFKNFAALLLILYLTYPFRLQAAFLETSRSSLKSSITSLINHPQFNSAFWGIQIVSLQNNEILFTYNEKKRLPPASGMKLLVSAAALDHWGKDYQFKTPVFFEGRLDKKGRLLGNLVLVGKGDPNLEKRIYKPNIKKLIIYENSAFIESIADQIVEYGIRKIEGNIIVDTTLFLNEPFGRNWDYEDLLWGYGAPCSALSIHENSFNVSVFSGEAIGDPSIIEINPKQQKLDVINKVITVPAEKGTDIRIGRDPTGTVLTILGNISEKSPQLSYFLSISDPALNAATSLKSSLEKRGVFISGQSITRTLNPLEVMEQGDLSLDRARQKQIDYFPKNQISNWYSPPLIESLKILLKNSHNLYADMLLRALGAEKSGVGTLKTGFNAIETFLEKAGISKVHLNLSDASGLSRTNLLTPESIVRLLQFMDQHPQGQKFLESLAVAGQDGTLRHRMKNSSATGRVFAKTGSLRFVSSLCGYVQPVNNNEKIAFAIIVNNYEVSKRKVNQTIDSICALMADLPILQTPFLN